MRRPCGTWSGSCSRPRPGSPETEPDLDQRFRRPSVSAGGLVRRRFFAVRSLHLGVELAIVVDRPGVELAVTFLPRAA